MKNILALLCLSPFLFGFVLISSDEAKLDVTANAPTAIFQLGEDVPRLSGKGSFKNGIYADLSDEEFFLALVQETMAIWNDVYSSYLVLEVVVNPEAKRDEKDEVHSIVLGSVNASSAAFAVPTVEDGKIIDCDIQLGKKKTDAKTFGGILLHEFGHCLGLGHNHSNYGSIMGYSHEGHGFKLGADDIAGVTYLYPDPNVKDTDRPKELIGCGTLGNGRNYNLPAIIFMLLPLLALLRVPRSRQ